MPRSCSVPGCRTNYEKGNTQSAFKFPNDPDLSFKWLRAIHRENFTPTKHSVVCIKHFEERFVIREASVTRPDGTVLTVKRERLKLTEDAFPTIFYNQPVYMSKSLPPQRKDPAERHKEIRRREERKKNDEAGSSLPKRKKKQTEAGSGLPKRRKKQIYDKSTSEAENSKDCYYVTCCALGCTNTSESHVLTRLPVDPKRRQQWISKINRQDWVPTKTSALCQIHFEADSWEEDALGVRVLKSDVLPTLNLNGESINSQVIQDWSNTIKNALDRNSIDSETNVDVIENSVYIKEETLDIDDVSGHSIYIKEELLEADIVDEEDPIGNEDIGNEAVSESELLTIVPDIWQAHSEGIKTEPVDLAETTSTTSSSQEAGKNFKESWDLEHRRQNKHSKKGSSQIQVKSPQLLMRVSDPQTASTSISENVSSSTLINSVETACNSSTSRLPETITQSIPKAGPSSEVALSPPTPTSDSSTSHALHKSSFDSSDTFFMSLAQFPKDVRVGVKRKMVEVVKMVEKLKVNPKRIIIAHRAESP